MLGKLGSSPRRVKPSVQISRTGLSCVFHVKSYETDSCGQLSVQARCQRTR
jgi:hypothetical protein